MSVESVCWFLFVVLEVPLTCFAGVFALVAPHAFAIEFVPPHLRSPALELAGSQLQIVGLLMEVYGVVLVLLGLFEFGIFMVKGQVQSKRALLIAMLVADLIHIYVFVKAWTRDAAGSPIDVVAESAAWSSREWISVFTNVPMIVIMCSARGIYLLCVRPDVADYKADKGSKMC